MVPFVEGILAEAKRKRKRLQPCLGIEYGGGGGCVRDIVRDGIFLFLCSHHVLHVPHDVPQVYNCSPKVFSIAPHFIPYSLPKALPFSHIYPLHPHIEVVILRSLSTFSCLGDGPIKTTHFHKKTKQTKKKKKLERQPI
jgi:hypothetical protein